MSQDEKNLIQAINHDNSLASRLVYADWLEDHGDTRSAYLRAEVELAHKLETDKGSSYPLVDQLRIHYSNTRQVHDMIWMEQVQLKFDVLFSNLGAMSFPLLLWLKREQGYSTQQIDQLDAKTAPLRLGLKLGGSRAIEIWDDLSRMKQTAEPYAGEDDTTSSAFHLYLLSQNS